MKERPILFSAPMVRAILRRDKTQTRRVLSPRSKPGFGLVPEATIAEHREFWDLCPYGQPGDRLWVQESFYVDLFPWAAGGSLVTTEAKSAAAEILDTTYYRADGECCDLIPECQCWDVGKPRWRASRFMPRYLSRITLEVVSVRAERVQAISEADAVAEGRSLTPGDPRGYFPETWDLINAKRGYGWNANPRVWVVGFKVVSTTDALCPSVPSAPSVVRSPA